MSTAAPTPAPWAEARLLAFCVLGALALGLLLTWPIALDISGVSSDSRFAEGHIAALGLMARTPIWHTWTTLAGAPEGVDFRPLLWPAGVVARLTGAVAAYNLVLLCTPALNVLGGWVLGTTLRFSARQALGLGAALAMPPWVRTTLQNGQPEQALLGSGALLLAIVVWAGQGSRFRTLAVPLATFALGVATPHVVLACLVLVLVHSAFTRRARPLLNGALALLGALAVSWYHAPGFDSSIQHFFAPFGLLDAADGPVPKRSIQATDLLLQATLPPGKSPYVLHLGYVGFPLLAAAAWAGVRTFAAPRSQIDHARWSSAAALVCVVLAVSDAQLLAPFSPALSASGTPYRFTLGAVLACTIAAAHTRAIWPLAALSLAEAAWIDPRPLPFPTFTLPNDVSSTDIAARTAGRGRDGMLLDLPPPGTCRNVASHYLIEASEHGVAVPLVLRSGEIAFPYRTTFSGQLERALNAADCSAQLAPLLAGFDVVVAHKHPECLLRETQLVCIQSILGRGHQTPDVSWWVRAERL